MDLEASDSPLRPPRHLLTVALEDYFQVAPLQTLVPTRRWSRFESRAYANTHKALELLDEFDARATFFVVAWIADQMPELVAEVVARGHEVASKGYFHHGLDQMDREQFRQDVRRSKQALERASGRRVWGFRIAQNWFGPQDLWALDVLAEEGFAYDSSLRPLFRRFASEPWRREAHLHRNDGLELQEIPLSSWSLGGWSWPISGGNYMRQLPHAWVRRAVARWHRDASTPFVMYFHVWDLDPEQPKVRAAPWLERIRQYRNLSKMPDILRYYLQTYRFESVADYLGLADQPAATMTASTVSPEPTPTFGPRTAVTIVVPCFEEQEAVPYLARTLAQVATDLATSYQLSFVLVDDGSHDGTWAALRSCFGARPDCRLLRHESNRGVAAAILTGIRAANTEVVASIDCDCTYDPAQLRRLLPRLEPGVDLVTASPYHPQGEVRGVPAWRLFLSRNLSRIYGRVLRHRLATYTSCFRVYRRSSVIELEPREQGFLGVAEMLGLLDLGGGCIVEEPAVLETRLLGQSKMKTVRTILGHLRLIVRLATSKSQSRKSRSREHSP